MGYNALKYLANLIKRSMILLSEDPVVSTRYTIHVFLNGSTYLLIPDQSPKLFLSLIENGLITLVKSLNKKNSIQI